MARWLYTFKRPPNHVEMVHRAKFSADELFEFRQILHDRVDALFDEVRQSVSNGQFNVWRIGEFSIRWRAGRAVTASDYASVSDHWLDSAPEQEDIEDKKP